MTNNEKIRIANKCGLVIFTNQDGELEFLGTEKQWQEFENYIAVVEEYHENETEALIEDNYFF